MTYQLVLSEKQWFSVNRNVRYDLQTFTLSRFNGNFDPKARDEERLQVYGVEWAAIHHLVEEKIHIEFVDAEAAMIFKLKYVGT